MHTHIENVTNEHEEWKNTLALYKDELHFFRNRLDEVSSKNNTKPVLEELEHFQNQFDIHSEKISKLEHEINQYVHAVSTESEQHANHVTTGTLEEFAVLKEKMKTTTHLFGELKTGFMHFLEKVL